MTISFKNVGESTVDVVKRREDNAIAKMLPIGIMTPVRSGDGIDGIFKMHRTIAGQIKDNLKNLLLTNHGDRVIQYLYGANLRPLMLELTSQANFDSEAVIRIKRAVERFMPFITLIDFKSEVIISTDNVDLAHIIIRISYDVPAAKINNDIIDVVFFIGG